MKIVIIEDEPKTAANLEKILKSSSNNAEELILSEQKDTILQYN